MWFARSPPEPSDTRVDSGYACISSCITSTRDSSNCFGTYIANPHYFRSLLDETVGARASLQMFQEPVSRRVGRLVERRADVNLRARSAGNSRHVGRPFKQL